METIDIFMVQSGKNLAKSIFQIFEIHNDACLIKAAAGYGNTYFPVMAVHSLALAFVASKPVRGAESGENLYRI